MGLFGFGKKEKDKMKDGLEKTRTGFWGNILNTLTGSKIDDDLYDELEEQLILADVGGVFAGPQTQADAKETARQNLPAIESAARAALDEAGVDAPVRAELCRMYFTTRQYDDLMLPAGDYDAVRVTIGEGAGHNWWCVIFPPLCAQAAGLSERAVQALSDDDVRLVTESGGGYVVRFRLLELWDALVQRLS